MGKPRHRASVVCETEGHLLLVRLRDPTTRAVHVYPPGGGIEPGESPVQTAERETKEETGLCVRVEASLELIDEYPFTWDGVDYDCTTHYLAATLEDPFDPSPAPVEDAPYHEGAAWVPTAEALAQLAVHPRIKTAVSRLLGRARRFAWHRDPKLPPEAQMLLTMNDGLRSSSERLLILLEREPGTNLLWIRKLFEPLAALLKQHRHAPLQPAIEAVFAGLRETSSPGDAREALLSFDDALADFLDDEEHGFIASRKRP
jgi:8-oxo-dGTP pyrophosphatase MutT (NUDIX family)